MTAIHTTRALERGFSVLEALNQGNGARVSEVARATGFARTTTFRLLESLCVAGYVRRDPADGRYRLTVKVRNLSSGFEDSAWVTEIAAPLLDGLAGQILWPAYLSTLYGSSMIVRFTTTTGSRVPVDSYSTGALVPLMTSAAGKAYLAFCSDDERETLLNIVARSEHPEHDAIRDRRSLDATLGQTRRQGYALDLRAQMRRNPGVTSSLAVPVQAGSRVLASLTLRYLDAAMTAEGAVRRFVPLLRDAAGRLGAALADAGI